MPFGVVTPVGLESHMLEGMPITPRLG